MELGTFTAMADCRHGRLLYNRHDSHVGRSLELYGEYSEREIDLFRTLVRSGDAVVEAGANIGAHTVWFARAVGETGRVYAFEPQRLAFQLLCANLALNSIVNVFAMHKALGDVSGIAAVPALDPRREANFGGVSLLGGAGPAEPVETGTVDDLNLTRLGLLKADVEGMELAVLRGAEGTLARLRPVVHVENLHREQSRGMIEWLTRRDYRLWWHLAPLYNADNFRGNPVNVFGGTVSVSMLGVPGERAVAVQGLPPVAGPDDWWERFIGTRVR